MERSRSPYPARWGVRAVVLHTDRTAGTPQAGAATKPVRGLGVEVEHRGPLVIYDLEPPPSSAVSLGSASSG